MKILFHKICLTLILTYTFFSCENLDKTINKELDNQDFVAPKNISKSRQFTQGIVSYNIPDTMTLKEKARIELRISRNKKVLNIRRNLKGKVTTETIKVGKVMEARLIGNKFKIENLSSNTQWIDNKDYTVWEWNVTPLEFGNHDLHLKIIAKRDNYNQDFPVLDKKIYVHTSNSGLMQHFWEENWQWILSAIVFPIIGWFLVRILFRKPPKNKTKRKKR